MTAVSAMELATGGHLCFICGREGLCLHREEEVLRAVLACFERRGAQPPRKPVGRGVRGAQAVAGGAG